jgi:hypothetical protein
MRVRFVSRQVLTIVKIVRTVAEKSTSPCWSAIDRALTGQLMDAPAHYGVVVFCLSVGSCLLETGNRLASDYLVEVTLAPCDCARRMHARILRNQR